jgi:hypothetical protein
LGVTYAFHFFISEQCITLEKKMAKTKRRSCKGRRRSLKRGGVPFTAIKDTVSNFANRTASAARGLRDSVSSLPGKLRGSVSGIYKRLTTDPRFEQDKLIRANMNTKDADEGAGLQNFLKRSNEIYDTSYHKVGQYYDDHPYFLPDHYNPKVSWTMSKMGGH